MNWKVDIIKLLDKIDNQTTLQRIFKFISRLYVHS